MENLTSEVSGAKTKMIQYRNARKLNNNWAQVNNFKPTVRYSSMKHSQNNNTFYLA